MRKEELLKRIIENPEFKKNYWPNFDVNPKPDSYNHATILRSKNPYLISLYSLTQDEKLTTNILYKQILNTFKV
jgi:hypothetical protein